MSAAAGGHTANGGWKAKWIAKPVPDHRSWSQYSVEVRVKIEASGGSVLFGVQEDGSVFGCELNAASGTVSLYSVDAEGKRREWGRAAAPELAQPQTQAQGTQEQPTEQPLEQPMEQPRPQSQWAQFMEVAVRQSLDAVRVELNGREALSVAGLELRPGTIGFRTEEGQTAVFRNLRVISEDGRHLYLNNFYEPDALQFTGGQHAGPAGLRLEQSTTAVCESPISAGSPLFRRSFTVPDGVVKATVRVYSIGWYELRVNGRKLDNRVLAPANSPYKRRMLYDAYDVTEALQSGGNVFGIWLGNGYGLNYNRYGWKWIREKAVLLQLDMELADGTVQHVVTDETWLAADSPLLANDIYDGEIYDARKELPGWDAAGFDDSGWSQAIAVQPPEGELLPCGQPPVTTHEPLRPVRVLHPREGAAVYDFGQNIAGWVRVQVEGAAGGRLTLRHSELIDAEGNIDPWTSRRAKATDVYIAAGRGVETYEPRFTYHGFRYVEASGDLDIVSIEAVPIHADVPETGRFRCSDPLIEQIQSNLRWSILNNLVSIPTDCCQRDERTPCLMDSATVEEAAMHNFDMHRYYLKWLDDIEDSMANPDWGGDKVTLLWRLYWHYGDTEVLRKHYGTVRAYIDHLAAKHPEGIVESGFGDWCAPNEGTWESYFREAAIVNTSLYYRQTLVAADAAGVLGLPEDREKYLALAESIRRAFHERFHQGGGVYGSGSQTAQIMPLAFGMVPEEIVPQAVRSLVNAIEAKNRHVDTGIYATRYLLDVLADHGHVDLAYEMLTQRDYPSFGWQIAQGATTLWEQWSFAGGMNSHDHAMFAGIGTSFYTRLGGIRALSPGYGRIAVEPCVPDGLEWAEASLDTVKGRIVSSWRKEGGRLHLAVELPAQTTAVIRLQGEGGTVAEHEAAGPGRFQYVR